MLRRLVFFLTNILSYIIPVKKNYLVFLSNPDYADNAYAVFMYMLKQGLYQKYSFCWLLSDVSQVDYIKEDIIKYCNDSIDIKYCKRKSIGGVWASFRARYIINTCGLFSFIKYHQKDKRINMWHGMPIKRIYSDMPNGDVTIATSELFIPIMSKGLNISEDNVLLIGQPRNDLMFYPELSIYKDLKRQYKTIGIWLPTFRRTWIDSYKDGVFNDDGISFMDFSQMGDLNELLLKNNSILIIKLHPLDILQKKELPSFSNVKVYNNKSFHNKELYPLLGLSDYMLTDYSSVAIDYEMLKRPIGLTLDHIEEYGKDRGFSITDFPGVCLYSYDEMKAFIQKSIDGQIDVNDYGDKFNKYKDANSTRRLIDCLGL